MELGLVALALLSSLQAVWGLTITVNMNNGTEVQRLYDENAAFQDRSYMLPREANSINGLLVSLGPNPCVEVPFVDTNLSLIAYVPNYDMCPELIERAVYNARYAAMVAFTTSKNEYLNPNTGLPQALFSDRDFDDYLRNNVLINMTASAKVYIKIWDDSLAKLEQLFIIFGAILLAAVFLSILIFCCSFCCRAALYKWRTRGLTRWQVRQLPRRRYRKSKETSETCSICLEDFKEGVSIRVLPCGHVFHPKCVDEWLQKWNRTCPLCKSTIKRRGGARANVSPDETSQLLTEEGLSSVRASFNEEPQNYGTLDSAPLLRSASEHSNRSSTDSLNGRGSPTSIELSMTSSSQRGSRERVFHTPIGSDDEGGAPSFRTAEDGLSTSTFDRNMQ